MATDRKKRIGLIFCALLVCSDRLTGDSFGMAGLSNPSCATCPPPAQDDEMERREYEIADVVSTHMIWRESLPIGKHLRQSEGQWTMPVRPAPDEEAFLSFIDLLTRSIDPKTWRGQGGVATFDYDSSSHRLVIHQTAAIHERIAAYLEMHRRLDEIQILVHGSILVVPLDVFERNAELATWIEEQTIITAREMRMTEAAALAGENNKSLAVPATTIGNGQILRLSPGSIGKINLHDVYIQIALNRDREHFRVSVLTDVPDRRGQAILEFPNRHAVAVDISDWVREPDADSKSILLLKLGLIDWLDDQHPADADHEAGDDARAGR